MPIFDAAVRYQAAGVPTVIFGGEEYGTGSSRDWAAKGTRLLGVRAVIARSFERIHRANLVGMGVLPLQFIGDDSVARLAITGDETFDVIGIDADLAPQQQVGLRITDAHGHSREVPLLLRIDTPVEIDYYRHDGILPCVLRHLLA
jgi:aconitate hydratase